MIKIDLHMHSTVSDGTDTPSEILRRVREAGIGLFALSTILSWSLYGSRCCEFLLGYKAVPFYQTLFVIAVVIGATLELDLVWNIADTLNGFMAIPNLIALLGLSGVVTQLTREHFAKNKVRI